MPGLWVPGVPTGLDQQTNVRADESWGTTATQFIAARLTPFIIFDSLLLVLQRFNPLVSASRKGPKYLYSLGVAGRFLSPPRAR